MTQKLEIDPAWFDPASVSEETRSFMEKLTRQAAEIPGLAQLGALEARKRMERGPLMLSPRGEDGIIPAPGGRDLQIRVLAPENPRGALLYFHGGGMILGSAWGQDERLLQIADGTGLACVAVNYRLAPEHPWPAPWDDGEIAALWLAENVRARFGGDFLAIAGDSAGAALAAPTLVRMRDRHGFSGFRAAALTCGTYDASGTSSIQRNGTAGTISAADVAYCTGCYAPDVATRKDPDLSVLYADLANLPPALFVTGTRDIFLDDSLFLAARWLAAGNAAQLAVYPGAPHSFVNFPIAIAEHAKARIIAFLKAHADAA